MLVTIWLDFVIVFSFVCLHQKYGTTSRCLSLTSVIIFAENVTVARRKKQVRMIKMKMKKV